MKYIIGGILLFGALFLTPSLRSQVINPCGTDEMNEQLIQQDPEIIQITEELEKFTREFISNKKDSKDTYVIPVVFHIMHNGGEENLPKFKIDKAIEIMNEDFSATNSDLINVIPEFADIIGTSNIEFRLARIDPDGNCTEGIIKVQTEEIYEVRDVVKYISPAWDRSKYLNIWSVGSVRGAAAYSNYPSSVQNYPELDGIVSKYTYVGSGHTLSHEVGHYLNLIHPWGSTNSPALDYNCQTDDNVEDTPNTRGSAVGSCNLSQFTCGSLDNVQNIMDYSSCDRMFTQGQVDRMHAALNSSVSSRNNLWSEENLIATGTNDGYEAPNCAPIASMKYSENFGCQGKVVTFTDFSYNGTYTQRAWSFPGGIPSESNDSIVYVTYPDAGEFDVMLQVSNEVGSDELTNENFVFIEDTLTGYTNPVAEDFENSSFPVNTENEDLNWAIDENGNASWEYTEDAAFSGNGSVRIKNYLNGENTTNTLYSPNIVLGDFVPGVLSFRMAYAKKYDFNMDELKVYFSPNCGNSWSLRYIKSGSSLSDIVQTLLYVPEQNEWRLETIDLSAIADWEHLKIKIEMISNGGNCLYLDDMKIEAVTAVREFKNHIFTDLSVYPNPINQNSVIAFHMKKSNTLEFSIYNLFGQTIANHVESMSNGKHEMQLMDIAPDLAEGVYFIKLSSQGYSNTVKFSVY